MKWFVSHFWGTAFQHFTDAVCRHAQSACTGEWQQEPYWICSFSNNQHVSLLQRSPVISKILSIQDPMKNTEWFKSSMRCRDLGCLGSREEWLLLDVAGCFGFACCADLGCSARLWKMKSDPAGKNALSTWRFKILVARELPWFSMRRLCP